MKKPFKSLFASVIENGLDPAQIGRFSQTVCPMAAVITSSSIYFEQL